MGGDNWRKNPEYRHLTGESSGENDPSSPDIFLVIGAFIAIAVIAALFGMVVLDT